MPDLMILQNVGSNLLFNNSLSFAIRISVLLIRSTSDLGFGPNPSVIYPVIPVNAPIPGIEVVACKGVATSVVISVSIEKTAYSVGEYAKLIVK